MTSDVFSGSSVLDAPLLQVPLVQQPWLPVGDTVVVAMCVMESSRWWYSKATACVVCVCGLRQPATPPFSWFDLQKGRQSFWPPELTSSNVHVLRISAQSACSCMQLLLLQQLLPAGMGGLWPYRSKGVVADETHAPPNICATSVLCGQHMLCRSGLSAAAAAALEQYCKGSGLNALEV